MNNYCNRLIKVVDEVGVWLEKEEVPFYSGTFSKKLYTQHQLLKGLVVKTLFRLRYRELVDLLEVADSLRSRMGLSKVPHYTTFQKFSARFSCRILHQLIAGVAKKICSGTLNLSIDSTGFSLDVSSYHYSSRIKRMEKNRGYVKTTLAIDTRTQCVAAAKIRLKRRHDTVDAVPILNKSRLLGRIQVVVADRGYDSEELMQYIEHEIHAKPVIALKYAKKSLKRTRGEIRKRLKKAFPKEEYRHRSKSETVNSTIKRRYDSTIRARKNHTQRQDVLLKILTYNLTLLNKTVEILKDFYRAQNSNSLIYTIQQLHLFSDFIVEVIY
jgi:transposase